MTYFGFIFLCFGITMACHLIRFTGYRAFFEYGNSGGYSKFRARMVIALFLECILLFILISKYWAAHEATLTSKSSYISAIWLWTLLPVGLALGFELARFFYERQKGIPHILYERIF